MIHRCLETFKENRTLDNIRENWSVTSLDRNLLLKRNGLLRLCANSTETLEKVIFDTNKKTVAVEVSNKKREDVPRIADISDDVFFFDKLRENMEDVLSVGGFTCTAVNEDRTVFEVQ